jgi:hypothetical protein
MTRRERDLRRLAAEHGYVVAGKTAKSQWRLRHPSGATVIASFTPSVRENDRVLAAEMRREVRRAASVNN